MNRSKYIALFLITICGLVILGFEIIFSGERPKSEFKTFKEVEDSGLIGKGWIPPFIPKSSFNIKEQHDLDTNRVTMSFEYKIDDIEKTRSACDSERKIDNGIEFTCKYLLSNVTITLLNNGTAKLHSYLER